MRKLLFIPLMILFSFGLNTNLASQEVQSYPIAIFDFSSKVRYLPDIGEKVSTVIFADLVTSPNLIIVDREEIDVLLDEATLNLSGMVNLQQANQVGQLTGAKIIVTGTIFEIDKRLMMVSKIIGTETSRVFGASVKGDINSDIIDLSERLSKDIKNIIINKSKELVAPPSEKVDRLASLKISLHNKIKPTITVKINEHHINRASTDPAAETEMIYYGKELGFEVVENVDSHQLKAEVLITGEGFTEFATRKGDLIGVKARLEVRAIDLRTNKILAIERQTEMEVDLSEIIAAKSALQKASAKIAERMLPKLIRE